MSRTIAFCEIIRNRYTNEVIVTYDDDSVEMIFRYYPDELSFSQYELVGLTRDEAMELFEHKNRIYLRG